MVSPIHQLLLDRATAMAAHDGAPVSPVYLVGATGQLQAELMTARDTALSQLRAPAAQPPIVEQMPIPVTDAAPIEPIVAPIVEEAPVPMPAPEPTVAPATTADAAAIAEDPATASDVEPVPAAVQTEESNA